MNIFFPSFLARFYDRAKENFQEFLSRTFFSFVGGLGEKLRTSIIIPYASFTSQKKKLLKQMQEIPFNFLLVFLFHLFFLFSSLPPLKPGT